MQQKPSSSSRVLLFAIFFISALDVGAQEFKGFYGNDYTSGHSSQRHFWRKAARRYNNPVQSNLVLNYGNNGTYYANGSHTIPFQGFYGTANPAGSVVINILPAGFPPSAGTSNYYYYNGTDYRRNNTSNVVFPDQRRDYDYLQLPESARSIKINGTRFYEMDGNYYRADYFDNAGRSYTTSNGRGGNNYFRVEDGSVKDNNIYLPARRSDNVAYVNDSRPAAKTVYLTDGYQNGNGEYVNRRAADIMILMSQQEQQAMRDENALLKQQLQQKDADNRAVMKAAIQRQDEQAKQAEQQRDDAFKRTDEAAEQAQREQKAMDNQRIKEQQEANKAEDKRRKKTNNYVSEADLYSNLKVGDTVDQIPKDSKEVTIDGKKTYLAPGNTFYRKQNGKYTVVGKQ